MIWPPSSSDGYRGGPCRIGSRSRDEKAIFDLVTEMRNSIEKQGRPGIEDSERMGGNPRMP